MVPQNNWKRKIQDLLSFLIFKLRRVLIPSHVSVTPVFDSPAAIEFFIHKINNSRKYLEFGSGGSTHLAAVLGISFITVDSDRKFLNRLIKVIKQNGLLNEENQLYSHVDIGVTREWGWPFAMNGFTDARLKKFKKYSDPPTACQMGTFIPDLILVDGRFRVACALKIARLLNNKTEWSIVVDDYVNRPCYKILEDFLCVESKVGRMVLFNKLKQYNKVDLDKVIECYEIIPE